jgi:hypothetical protein
MIVSLRCDARIAGMTESSAGSSFRRADRDGFMLAILRLHRRALLRTRVDP